MTTPCSSWAPNDFLTESPRLRALLISDCERCPQVQTCRQLAADSPFSPVGIWGGLVLPEDKQYLPPPTDTGAAPVFYHKDGKHKGKGYKRLGRPAGPLSEGALWHIELPDQTYTKEEIDNARQMQDMRST